MSYTGTKQQDVQYQAVEIPGTIYTYIHCLVATYVITMVQVMNNASLVYQ